MAYNQQPALTPAAFTQIQLFHQIWTSMSVNIGLQVDGEEIRSTSFGAQEVHWPKDV
jgi:hypothetical protein